jgi:hypothetical protein
MNTPLPQVPPSNVSPVCRMLRTKTAFGSYCCDGDGAPWHENGSTTAVYWCLCTMETAGPDDVFAHPQSCRAGRTCYRAEAE